MPMIEMQVGKQIIRHDREATAAIYASLKGGWIDNCGCAGCRNLMAQKDAIYPPAFREMIERLGIDCNKEGEAVPDGPLENGLHYYGGWFCFVGEMVTAGDEIWQVRDSPYFGYFFTRGGPCPEAFRGVPHLGIEFVAHLKWILNEPWDSGLRAAGAPNARERPE